MKTSLTDIKFYIEKLYHEKAKIKVDIDIKKERKHFTDIPAVLTGVYPNVFTLTLFIDKKEKNYSFQYSDLLTENIKIKSTQ